MESRFYEELTDFWQQAQRRLWTSSLNLSGPDVWANTWGPSAWRRVDWTPFVARPGGSASGSIAEQSARQVRHSLNPDRYLPLLRIGTRNVQTCLEIQKQMWHYWFEVLEQSSKSMESWRSVTQSPTSGPSKRATRGRRAATRRGAKKSRARKKSVAADTKTASVQLELESKDDLKKIHGIGPGLEKQLNNQGIVSYRQIAELSPRDVERLETTVIKFPGRILRDNWIGQAKALCGA